jgi:hypothetical protein
MMTFFLISLYFYRLRHTDYNIKITIVEAHCTATAQKRDLQFSIGVPSRESNPSLSSAAPCLSYAAPEF